ncbi:EcsC family protein [Marinicrinis lubricantis]|uniref:EcsC family protein n=1 Tax=Marinicrinis lubricantis TaxID=2086470 RepID=A0ABW1ILE9_9BACL
MDHFEDYYEGRVKRELAEWEKSLFEEKGFLFKASKQMSMKMNQAIPKKAQQAITSAVKVTVKSVLTGAKFIPKNPVIKEASLYERDQKAIEFMDKYRKIAVAEGAATGAGGILLGLADFPAFLAIKMNLLFEIAHIYGYDTRSYAERVFILYLFQLAFSSNETRRISYEIICSWKDRLTRYDAPPVTEPEWETFQQEYRDSIDFRKMLQLLPGIGAIVGAWANNGLTKELGHTAMNGYRLRYLADHPVKH